VIGVVPGGPVDLVAVDPLVGQTRKVIYRTAAGQLGEQILMRINEPSLRLDEQPRTPFDADPEEFKLAAEAVRIKSAALIDPMLAVTSSHLEPLPHQIEAVYGHMLDRVPLRYLLADDPGAGKTIMAGLYIKELLLRGDLSRCLIVAPGGLVEQWQYELRDKFGLRFDVLGNDMIKGTPRGSNVFAEHPRLIARMDQLSRSQPLKDALRQSAWDLVVVDEAHRMSAHFYGRKVEATARYNLGRLLGETTHHLLLMTATPHTGKEADFQLFLALLDGDRFEGRHQGDAPRPSTGDLMLRRTKEELLTFSGTPLFPVRRAYTVPYELSDLESELYERVTAYVRQEFNRADQLEKARGNTVGFAMTVLQRRLASSPEAILRSLERRQRRLEDRLKETLAKPSSAVKDERVDLDDAYDAFPGPEQEEREEEVVDAATAARTAAELRYEIAGLGELVELARRVHRAGSDRKWSELSELLTSRPEMSEGDSRRKLIIFTEHRDTLAYLRTQITRQLDDSEAVTIIHGGLSRDARLAAQRRFTDDADCVVLIATDAAGEGLNLQRAHLMVNYDLPWNPNRIEQRFGRIHRIGQKHMCHLWNLVAANTREGEVFQRLLAKVEEQNAALGGKVFDVLGAAFEGEPLHRLLIDAIRRGDDPKVKHHLDQVIDERVGDVAVKLIQERALNHDVLSAAEVDEVGAELEDARTTRLQPHYVEGFFRDAFARAGGRMSKREPHRFQIMDVPVAVRELQTSSAPIRLRYERVCFDRMAIRASGGGAAAELLSPGHPLLDAVVRHTIDTFGPALERGTILVDRNDPDEDVRLLIAVSEEIVDGGGHPVARRFTYVEMWQDGRTRSGSAPFLDYAGPDDSERQVVSDLARQGWPAMARTVAEGWAAGQYLPEWYARVSERRSESVARARKMVEERLTREIAHCAAEIDRLSAEPQQDRSVRDRQRAQEQRATDLRRRLVSRLAELDKQAHAQARPPSIVAVALVVPQGLIDRLHGHRRQPVHHYSAAMAEVERRAIERVLREERQLGRKPEVMTHNNPGYDIRSRDQNGHLVYIEVKGRETGADTFFVTNREIRTGQNADNYRLALVDIDLEDLRREDVRYLHDPFAAETVSALVNGVQFRWKDMWEQGGPPA
jgi:superfamily II DNA or RNA helicase